MFALNNLDKKRITNGRMFVYKLDTTELANVYTYENSEYVEAPNPIYFVDGIPNNTYFFDNNIYDVVVQEYVGDSSDPSGDLRIDVWPESFSTKIGIQAEVSTNNNAHLAVHTMDGLRHTNVGENLYVDVIGYWTDNDCERRTYYWDSTCVNIADGGLIVDSEVSDTGRWILICNEIMKSEYYGVYGTHQENLNKLFSYNDLYGSMSLVSPKTIMIAPGEYGDEYTIYCGYGKHVIFSHGVSFEKGNVVRCLSYEGVGTIGNIEVGFDKNGEALYCGQTARFSNFHNLLNFLQCNAQCLIFDEEYNYDNPESNDKFHLTTYKTLRNIRCVFEKPFGFFNYANEQSGRIIFDKCSIDSDHKIRKSKGISFKNMRVSDKWFYEPWNVEPNPTFDVDCEYLTNDFEYADSYIDYKLNNCGSAVVLDCDGMKLHTVKTIAADGLSSVEINGLRTNEYGVTLSTPTAVFNDCTMNSAFVYSPVISAFDTEIKYGYLAGNNPYLERHFERCRFGGYNKTDFRMEGATSINLYVKSCDFTHRYQPFYSENGLNLSTGSKTYFYDNKGIGDGPSPTVYYAGINTNPISIVSGLLTWEDEVGNVNWVSGKTTYQMTPWRVDTYQKQIDRYEYVNRNFNGYLANGSYITTSSTPGYPWLVYTNDFKRVNGLVFDLQKQCFSADFYPSGHGSSFEIENESVRYLGTVTLNKIERG